jgi:hypothetical protein
MNVCKGPALYDIARTVFLIQYSQVPEPVPDPEALKAFQKALAMPICKSFKFAEINCNRTLQSLQPLVKWKHRRI